MKSAVALLNDAQRIEELHQLATKHASNAVQYAVECGRKLLAVKAELPHGDFGKWCEGLTFAYKTARTYMLAASRTEQIGSTAASLVTDAAPSLRSFMAATAPKPTVALDVKHSARSAKRLTKKDEERLADLREAKARGVSMLTTYARLTLTALRSQDEFTDEEQSVLDELAEAIQKVSELER